MTYWCLSCTIALYSIKFWKIHLLVISNSKYQIIVYGYLKSICYLKQANFLSQWQNEPTSAHFFSVSIIMLCILKLAANARKKMWHLHSRPSRYFCIVLCGLPVNRFLSLRPRTTSPAFAKTFWWRLLATECFLFSGSVFISSCPEIGRC